MRIVQFLSTLTGNGVDEAALCVIMFSIAFIGGPTTYPYVILIYVLHLAASAYVFYQQDYAPILQLVPLHHDQQNVHTGPDDPQIEI